MAMCLSRGGTEEGREGEKWLHVLEMTSGIFIPSVFTLGSILEDNVILAFS